MTLAAPEAEQAVLSAVLASSGKALVEVDTLKPEHFEDALNREVFELARGIWEGGGKPDYVTVGDALRDRGIPPAVLDDIRGSGAGDSENLGDHAALIMAKWRGRRIVDICNGAADSASDGAPEEVLDELERQIIELRPDGGSGLKRVDGADFFAALADTGPKGLPSGIKEIDAYLGGLGSGRLITFASRPGVGKTTLALNIAANAAGYGARVAFFSLEMAYGELLERVLARESHLSGSRIRTAKGLTIEDYETIREASDRVTQWPLYIDDTAALGTFEIAARSKKLKHDAGLDLVVVDYLQLMTPPKAESRVQEVAVITRTLKLLARELQCPVLALSQLSRAAEIRGGKPQQSDLRESGSIENDSDQIVMLWRDEGDTTSDDRPSYVNVSISKNRHGPTGDFKLEFVPSQSRFRSV